MTEATGLLRKSYKNKLMHNCESARRHIFQVSDFLLMCSTKQPPLSTVLTDITRTPFPSDK